MKKLPSLIAIVFVIVLSKSYAQDIPILFEVNNETYTLLENPVSLNDGELWDGDSDYPIDFGFDFEIYGTVYSSLVVNAGIGITFPGAVTRNVWIWGSEWGGWPLLLDNGTEESLSPIDYEIVGDPGDQILKIQWINAGIREIDEEGEIPDDYVDFQIWVCEGTNRIEIHYGASQTVDTSFGYLDGPGCRFWEIEDYWGLCLSGDPNSPSWDWVEMEGPYGGCLLDGVPDEGTVFNFYPNPTVLVDEKVLTDNMGCVVTPNPFNSSTTIRYHLNNPQTVCITFFNQHGKQVGIAEKQQPAGSHKFIWKPVDLPSGIYYFTVKTKGNLASGKVMKVAN